jgi:hypothetical protein
MRDPATLRTMTARHATAVLAGITLLVLVLSLPGSLRDAFDRAGIYLFSRAFFEDLPLAAHRPGSIPLCRAAHDRNAPRHPEWAGRRAGGTAAVSLRRALSSGPSG